MNRKISLFGCILTGISVVLFSIFLICRLDYFSYFICIFLSIGYIIMTTGFVFETDSDRKISASLGLVFAVIYAVFVIICYFTQLTAVRIDNLNQDFSKILDYSQYGLMFYIDLLGYGMMALSTFYIGLSVKVDNKKNKLLKWLLICHGIFFFPCLIMPMTGLFSKDTNSLWGIGLLCFWCLYFLPITILSFIHFKNQKSN